MKILLLFLTTQLVIISAVTGAESHPSWCVEYFGGAAYAFNMPLTVSQSGFDDIDMTAQYDTQSFQIPMYYSFRVGRWNGDRAWELELIHMKVALKNKPAEIQLFEISHGYNMLMLNRAWRGSFIFRLGAGAVIAHPENTVRGQELDEDDGFWLFSNGNYLAGVAAQASVGKRFNLSEHAFVAIEGKLTAAQAEVPVVGGHAHVPTVAVHGLLGLGWDF
jgi:hypothetical protein